MSDVNTENKLYTRAKYRRRVVRDALGGSDAVKRAGELYLPIPSGFLYRDVAPSVSLPNSNRNYNNDLSSTDVPYYHTNKAFSSYMQRARYPEIVLVARSGLVGLAVKKTPEIKLPSQIAYLENDAGKNGETIYEIFAESIAETLVDGNCAIQVDVDPETNKLFLNIIPAKDIIDWSTNSSSDTTTFVNIQRDVDIRNEDNIFEVECKKVNTVFTLTDKKAYVEQYIDGELQGTEEEKDKPLTRQGADFDEIPIFPIGAIKNDFKPQTAPLFGLAEIALSIYRKDADLSNSEYMTCNPNLVMTGVDSDIDPDTGEESGIPNVVGSQVALIIANPDAKVYYTETDTSALEHMRNAIKDLFEEATVYSVSLIGEGKVSAESTDTVKIRQSAQNATLVTVVRNCGKAIIDALNFCARNNGAGEVEFKPNLEFSEKVISSQLLQALIQAWVARGLSLETLLRNFKEAGILDENTTVEAEMTRLSSEPPKSTPTTIKS